MKHSEGPQKVGGGSPLSPALPRRDLLRPAAFVLEGKSAGDPGGIGVTSVAEGPPAVPETADRDYFSSTILRFVTLSPARSW